MVHKIIYRNKTKFAVLGVLGEMLAAPYEEKKLDESDKDNGVELFSLFDTEAEANAYIEGLNAAEGWNGISLCTDVAYHKEVFGDEFEVVAKGGNS